MRYLIRYCLLVLSLGSLPGTVWAWGVLGHRAIAKMAEGRLTPPARQELMALLGDESLASISTWADEYREWESSTTGWHFVNAPAGLSRAQYVDSLRHSAPGQRTLYTELPRLLRTLADKKASLAERRLALRFVVHLVGDAHQPLHAGRLADHGGNDLLISYPGKHYTNLHSYWDQEMVEYPGLTYTELAAAYGQCSASQAVQWAQDPLETWLFESYQACDSLYAEARQPNFRYDYFGAHIGLVKKRLAQAGIRLAAVLNQALDK